MAAGRRLSCSRQRVASPPRPGLGRWDGKEAGWSVLRGQDLIYAGFELPNLAVEDEVAGELAGQSDGCVEFFAVAAVLDLDDALRMGIRGCERGQRAQVGCYADRGKAGAGWLNARYQREQIVDGMGAPGVGVGAGVAGNFRPGAEVEGQEFAPGVDGAQVLIGQAGVVQGAGKIKAEVVGGA